MQLSIGDQDLSPVLTALSHGIVLRSASISRQCLDSDFGGTKSFTSTQGFDRTNIPAARMPLPVA